MPIVVFDLDGTLADATHRLHLLPEGADKNRTDSWDAFNLACWLDAPIPDNIQLLRSLCRAGHRIVILTGRCDVARMKTIDWLERYQIPYDNLVMRPSYDHRKDVDFKEDALIRISEIEPILCCFDDLEHVCKHIRGMGITCHQVTHYDAPLLHEQDHREGEDK